MVVVVTLAIIAALLWGAAIMITFTRTIVPQSFAAETIMDVSVHEEHQPGRDDAIFVRTDRRTLRVDPSAAACLRRGDTVSKEAWSMTVRRSDAPDCQLEPPLQLAAVAGVPILITVLTGGCLMLGRRISRQLQPGGG
ncbi:hypothetical protein [Microlunatus speluncae]|uniref:hypothetical protein n=1 Tax=Microlunatus speluncae TaxID=2594267 RepID=UPI0012662EC5|nr:hypothetical protein [Microlunatus speluncae]